MIKMFHPFEWLGEFNRKHKRLNIILYTLFFLLGFLTNVFLANGIVLINHYILKDDYKVNAIDIHNQYFSRTQKNFTVVVNNEWWSDLATKVDVYSKPSSNEITFNILCENCNDNVIYIEKQSLKVIKVSMNIGDIEKKFSICVRVSEYGNEDNHSPDACYPSDVISTPFSPQQNK